MPLWTIHLEGGPRRVNHAAVAIDDRIFSFGGYCTGEDYDTTRPMDVHILDTLTLRWRLLPTPDSSYGNDNIPYQRYGHTAITVDDCAYIWGGRNDKDGSCNILYCFDASCLKWSKPTVHGRIPGARDGHSACLIDNKMYTFGGFEEEIDRFSNEIHVLDITTMTWSPPVKTTGTPARWRDFHTAIGIDKIMYIFGGRSDDGDDVFTNNEVYCNKVHMFNTQTHTWSQLPITQSRMPSGRRSHSAFYYQGLMYIFGGYNGIYDQHFNDVFALDPVRMKWYEVMIKGNQPCPRRRQCCCMIGSCVYLFGGTSPNNQRIKNDTDLIDHSDLYTLDFSPSLKTLCKLAVLSYKLDTRCLPMDLRWDLMAMTTNNTISRSCNTNG